MRRKWKLLLIALLALIFGTITAYRILESPSRVLRHALHLERLPSSITNLRMGSDAWTDEVRGFYFEIAPDDFPALLVGRQFHPSDIGEAFEARTIHISPPIAFVARWQYRWETDGSRCYIIANEKKTRVIAIFSAD